MIRQHSLLFRRNRPHRGKISSGLLIQVDKADHAIFHRPGKHGRHFFKCTAMKLYRITIQQEYRIITPVYTLPPDLIGQFPESTDHFPLLRHSGLNLSPVRRNRHKPELTENPEFRKTFQRRRRILRAEHQHIHHFGIHPVAGHTGGMERIPHTDKTRADPVAEPGAVKCRNIRPVPGIQNHPSPTFILLLSTAALHCPGEHGFILSCPL